MILRGSGPVLLRNPIFLLFSRGGGGSGPSSGSAHDGATIDDEVRESGSTLIAIIIILKCYYERGCACKSPQEYMNMYMKMEYCDVTMKTRTNTETYRCSYKGFKWSKHSKNVSCRSFYNA